MERLILLLAEASVELIPPEAQRHPSVLSYCRRRGKDPRWALLDSSYHHSAMTGLAEAWKRGRPDILHFSLLEALGSPLNQSGLLETICHTYDGYELRLNPDVRLPRVYERFKGLMEKLYREGEVKAGDGSTLLRMRRASIDEVIRDARPGIVYLLSERGSETTPTELERVIKGSDRPLFIVGCFPHGDFSEETARHAEGVISISRRRLEAWVAVSRLLCAAERVLLDR